MRALSEILEKTACGSGMTWQEVSALLDQDSVLDWPTVHKSAVAVTRKNFDSTLRYFAPIYFSDYCINDCVYCGFKASNKLFKRKALTEEQFLDEARHLWDQGQRTLLLVAGEHPVYSGVGQVAAYIMALRRAGLDFAIGVEIGPLTLDDYKALAELEIERCVLYQETYNRDVYYAVHAGRKQDYDWRYGAMGRALRAGIKQVGIGVLLGLAPFEEEMVALVRHAESLNSEFGQSPATLSLARMQSVFGEKQFIAGAKDVSNEEYMKCLSIARLALPRSGITLTTRECEAMRDYLIATGLGVTHVSAGVSTLTGGYVTYSDDTNENQFDISDHRSLEAVTAFAESCGYQSAF